MGGTTTDSTVTWTNLGDKAPTGASAPPWNATVGGTTTDGAIIWKNLGSRFQLTGTSVWTNTNYLAMGILAPCGNTAASVPNEILTPVFTALRNISERAATAALAGCNRERNQLREVFLSLTSRCDSGL